MFASIHWQEEIETKFLEEKKVLDEMLQANKKKDLSKRKIEEVNEIFYFLA
jgi:hypothetical protein